jgi:hypothetical protein
MKNKSHPKVTFKWSSIDKALLPALSGVVKSEPLTVQRYEIFLKLPSFFAKKCLLIEKCYLCSSI